jgi:hypothetical protein
MEAHSSTTLGGYPSTQPSLAPMATFGSTLSYNNGSASPNGNVTATVTGADGSITVVEGASGGAGNQPILPLSPLGGMGRSISPTNSGRTVTPLSLPQLSPSPSTSGLSAPNNTSSSSHTGELVSSS